MLYDAFRELLLDVIAEIFLWVTSMAEFLVEISLKVEAALWSTTNSPLSSELINSIYNYIYGAVVILVALKFIWKGFQVYVLWRDGDADVSPQSLILGACLALVISIGFPTVYDIGVSVTTDLTSGVMDTINDSWTNIHIPDVSAVEPRAEAVWGETFAAYDTNGDGTISENEFNSMPFNLSTDGVAFCAEICEAIPSLIPGDNEDSSDPAIILAIQQRLKHLMEDGELNVGGISKLMLDGEKDKVIDLLNPLQGLGNLILILIYLILYVIMYLKLLARGVEMLFLRWGLPIASIGLVNSDGGIFPSYVQLILKQMATSMLQVIAMFLSFYIMLEFSLTAILIALAMLSVAFRAPALLAQITAPQRQGGGLSQKAYTGMMMWHMLRRR